MTSLSRRVLTEVFGTDFVNSLEQSSGGPIITIPEDGSPPPATSIIREDFENTANSIEMDMSRDLVHASPAKSHLVSGNHPNTAATVLLTNNTLDGPSKPKTPRRTSDSHDLMDFEENSGPFKKDDTSSSVLDNLAQEMQRQLNALDEAERKQLDSGSQQEGRLGPSIVKYDVGSHVGSFIISNDRLGVNSQCNFGSVRACSCVFKGKWQYEVQLGSNGVMQVGWATLETKFSQEKGVGDTIDSYAYDGNRLRKWNKSTAQYGETWQAGDIIGCCIDLDDGIIEFLRNGKTLGVAFSDIRKGSSVAYFPAVSLAYQENIIANFGATPLQFPMPGYSPMQSERMADNTKSRLLLEWLGKLLPMFKGQFVPDFGINPEHRTLFVITNRIMEFLGPHLHSGFVVEQSFFPFFAKILGLPERVSHTDQIASTTALNHENTNLLLNLMWTLLEESEMKNCLERMCVVLMNQFRSNSLSLEYPFQHYSLLCLLALSYHRKTRRHLIRHLLFDRTRLMQFLHVRPMDETVLKEIIPDTWWSGKSPESSPSAIAYLDICNTIQNHVAQIQALQVMFLKQLNTNDDGTDKRPSSRALFLRKFRAHVRDVIRPGSVLHQPVQKAMCTFFCFLKTISELYSDEVELNSNNKLPDIPPSVFYDTSVAYFDMERVGGLASYLYKTYHAEVADKLSIPDYISLVQAAQQHESTAAPVLPGVIHVSTAGATDVDVHLTAGTLIQNVHRTTGTSASAPAITIAVPPRHQPLLSNAPIPPPLPQRISSAIPHSNIPTSSAIRNAITEQPSVTSSGETVTASAAPLNHLPYGSLITGTPSGHNMLIPMLTDFRSLIADQGFTFYPGGFLGFANFEHRAGVQPQNPAVALLGKDCGSVDATFSLRELLDDAIIIFIAGVQSNVEKVVSLRTTMDEYEEALDNATKNLNSCVNEQERLEIEKSIVIFTNKLDEQARHLAWVKSAVFTTERQTFVFQLLKTVLATLKGASREGALFSFVPEHYISTLVHLTWLILTQMHPTVPYTNLPNLESILTEVAEFVAMHFADPRIVIAETKDTLTQALSTFICNRLMLSALEEMPSQSQLSMIKAILRPYENRAWAQSNWMLVRMWQGDGYGFQYPNSLEARRTYRAKPVQDEFGISTNLPPTPSKTLQSHVAHVLLGDQKFAVSYIHSVLNQLNWAFSEFVGLLQEIQSAASRPERVFIESRQLKICCTCFELTQALLRVMEMVVSIASPVLTDFSRDSAEPLLGRLCMLMSQVLNRIGSNTGCFAGVIELDIPGLENVTHFPILSAVAGILVGMIESELPNASTDPEEISATKTLLGEPSFQINSLDFFIGRNQSHVPEGRRIFSLRNHVPEDVSIAEISKLENVIDHLNLWSERLQPDAELIDDDLVCTICYAYPQNATLKPCNHRTCKTCILHHLMNRGECFFCKAVIQQVFLDDGTKIHDINHPAESHANLPTATTPANTQSELPPSSPRS